MQPRLVSCRQKFRLKAGTPQSSAAGGPDTFPQCSWSMCKAKLCRNSLLFNKWVKDSKGYTKLLMLKFGHCGVACVANSQMAEMVENCPQSLLPLRKESRSLRLSWRWHLPSNRRKHFPTNPLSVSSHWHEMLRMSQAFTSSRSVLFCSEFAHEGLLQKIAVLGKIIFSTNS